MGFLSQAAYRLLPILAVSVGYGAISFLAVAHLHAATIECVENVSPNRVGKPSPLDYPSGALARPESCTALMIRGVIDHGDFDHFADIVRENKPFLAMVYIDSPGGDVREAMRIGRLVRKLLLNIEAPSYFDRTEANDPAKRGLAKTDLSLFDADRMKPRTICIGNLGTCGCASACTLIWVAGSLRAGDVLGLHRPRFEDQGFAALDAESAQQAYRAALGEMTQYFKDMEAPAQFAEKMTGTPSSEVTWSEPKLFYDEYSPSIGEWLIANCGSYSREQKNRLFDLELRKNTSGVLTEAESNEKVSNENAYTAVLTCQNRKLANHRDSTNLE